MSEQTIKKVRPYWHVDAKWITGIICLFFLSTFLFNVALWQLTTEKVAVPIMGKAIAYMYSRSGLDNQSEIDKLKVKISDSPDGRLKPIPNAEIYITQADVDGKTPREFRLWLFDQVATPIYTQKGVDNPMNKFGVLAFVSQKTNRNFGWSALGFGLVTLIFGSLFVYFSAGFGRIFGPGLLLFLASTGNALFWGIATLLSRNMKITSIPYMGASGEELGKQLSGVFQFVAPDIAGVFFKVYIWALVVGVVLMVLAGILKLVFRSKGK